MFLRIIGENKEEVDDLVQRQCNPSGGLSDWKTQVRHSSPFLLYLYTPFLILSLFFYSSSFFRSQSCTQQTNKYVPTESFFFSNFLRFFFFFFYWIPREIAMREKQYYDLIIVVDLVQVVVLSIKSRPILAWSAGWPHRPVRSRNPPHTLSPILFSLDSS